MISDELPTDDENGEGNIMTKLEELNPEMISLLVELVAVFNESYPTVKMKKKKQDNLYLAAISVTNKYETDFEAVLRLTEDQSILEAFCYDWRESVKECIAKNPSASVSILEVLSKDLINVKIAVANNPSTRISILERLAKSSGLLDVRNIAKSALRRRKLR